LLLIVYQTALLDIDIVKDSVLPGLFAISAQEKVALEEQLGGDETRLAEKESGLLRARGIMGELEKRGDKWVLGGASDIVAHGEPLT